MMAALRQAKISCSCAAPAFDFTAEMKTIWSNINDAQRIDYCPLTHGPNGGRDVLTLSEVK